MIAKKPDDRFQSMTEVVAALESCRTGSASNINLAGAGSGTSGGNELQNFLLDIAVGSQSSATSPAGGTRTTTSASVTSSVNEATVVLSSGEAVTDPQTQTSLGRRDRKRLKRKSRGQRRTILIGSAIAGALLLASVVFFITTNRGTLQLSITDEQAEVTLGTTGRTVHGPLEESIKLPLGAHVLSSRVGDLSFDTPEITIAKNEPIAIKVERVGNRVRVMRGAEFLIAKEMPRTKPNGATSDSSKKSVNATPDFALRFDGDDQVTMAVMPEYSLDSLTIEAFVQPDAADTDGWIYHLGSNGGLGIYRQDGRWLYAHIFDPLGWFHLKSVQPAQLQQRVHVAGVCDKSEFRIYVDGKLACNPGSTVGSRFRPREGLPTIGEYFRGTIDELRVSKVARYFQEFTPPQRHEPDANTFALYHFDEGTGEVLKDSSGNNHHGQIQGAKWVGASGSLIASPPMARSIDLLPLVDLQRDAGVGTWKRVADGVACENPAGANVLQLPYEPPEEYDFEIDFTTTGSGLNVNQYVAAGGRMFAWKLNTHNVAPPLYGFELLDGKFSKDFKEAATQIPEAIKDGQRYRSTVEVRRGSLRTLLDGRELVKWTGDFKRFSMESVTPMKYAGRIGIGSWRRSVTFHAVTPGKSRAGKNQNINPPKSPFTRKSHP